MPPSPALRSSPRREIRAENHKRGRSLEGGLLLTEKDDDLALFNELQSRESDNFLLHSTADIDDSFSTKLRYFSDFKLGITIPGRGESSDLLNADGDKNDYDWLLTPPDTPLFPSLDDETPPVNLSHRGRPRSQPISISRSTMTEKSYRSSASPRRLSPSPQSRNNTFQSRGRTSSAPHSSPTPGLRQITPSQSPSTPPNKPATPAPRSSTPTSQRMITGSSSTVASSGRRGASPVRTNNKNSTSPKLQAWQLNLPGFSSDAPPNLRTSLSDRPASYVRGSSPASRNGRGLSPVSRNGRGLSPSSSNGRESSSKFGRQSMSPTASRSASSSYSHDRDQFSSQSKGSVASSGDDDIDSLQSVSVNISGHSAGRKVGAFPNSRSPVFPKKPSRIMSPSSAPKRSFDAALRQMDRRSPQNMFRPLLSSVPSSTFYVGKANSTHRPIISRNSSVTTSSNASSEQGASGVPDTDSSDHDQNHMVTERGKASYPDAQDEIFIFDKVDEINDDVGNEILIGKPNVACGNFESTISEVEPAESENCSSQNASAAIPATASKCIYVEGDLSEVDSHENKTACSKCGRKFYAMACMEGNDICPECNEKGGCLPLSTAETNVVIQSITINSEMTLEENNSFHVLDTEMRVPAGIGKAMVVQDEVNVEPDQSCLPDSYLLGYMVKGGEQHIVDQEAVSHPIVGLKQLKHFDAHPSLKLDVSEGVGISLLLKSSSRQTEACFQRQSSGRKADMENSRHDLRIKPQSRGSSFSGISNHAHHILLLSKSTSEEVSDVSVGNVEYDTLDETVLATEEKGRDAELEDTELPSVRTPEGEKLDHTEGCRTMDASASELSSQTLSIQLDDNSEAAFPIDNDRVLSGNAEEFPNNARSISDMEVLAMTEEPNFEGEDAMLNSGVCGIVVENPTHCSSIMVSGERENCHESTPDSQTDSVVSPRSKSSVDEFHEPSVPTTSKKDVPVSAPDSSILDNAHGILEESSVTVEGSGHMSRSLTLEEATDTILFCSSIIHDLSYQAATIGMEKENLIPLEGSWPTATIFGKSSSDRKDPRRRVGSKRTPKSQKVKQKLVETDVKTPAIKIETDIKIHRPLPHDSVAPNKFNSDRPLKLESKCNCTVM